MPQKKSIRDPNPRVFIKSKLFPELRVFYYTNKPILIIKAFKGKKEVYSYIGGRVKINYKFGDNYQKFLDEIFVVTNKYVKHSQPDKKNLIKKKKKQRTTKADYLTYLKSKEWQLKRNAILARDKHQCQFCGYKSDLQVHHISYKNIFAEDPDELITLCSTCHKKMHQ